MTPKAFNKAMGAVIRKERMTLGWSMETLGKQIGVTYQQIAKYEHGENSCSAHVVARFAEIFNIPVAELYERARINVAVIPASPTAADNDAFLISRHVRKIRDGNVRQAVIDFTRKLAYQGAKA